MDKHTGVAGESINARIDSLWELGSTGGKIVGAIARCHGASNARISIATTPGAQQEGNICSGQVRDAY
ncbi:MAG: hypothetical protein ABI196_04640 [Bradyrhizobium sp.]